MTSIKVVCVICGKGKGDGLVACAEDGCPVAVHLKCVPREPVLHPPGIYFCPFCIYKRGLVKLKYCKKKAALAKESIEHFVDMIGPDGGYEKQKQTEEAEEASNGGGKGKQKQTEVTSDGGNEKRKQAEEASNYGKQKQKQAEEASNGGGKRKQKQTQVKQKPTEEASNDGKQKQKQAQEASNPSKRSREADPETHHSMKEIPCQPKRRGSFSGDGEGPSLGTVRAKRSRPPADSVHKVKIAPVPQGRRARLNWSAEEEKKLLSGVREFSKTGMVNVPWRKILEWGSGTFDSSRTPMDLKDKWKNLRKKITKEKSSG